MTQAHPPATNNGGYEQKVLPPPRIVEKVTNSGGYETRVSDNSQR